MKSFSDVVKWNDAYGKRHEHDNKSVLDGITSGKVTAWDNAEKNAKDYADSLAGNYAESSHKHVAADITNFETAVATKVESYGYATEADLTLAEGRISTLEGKPGIGITADQIGSWDGEVGAKVAAQAAQKSIDDYVTAHANDYTNTQIDQKIGAVDTGVHSVSLASGTNNGTVKLTVDGTATDNIAVTGLKSAAYTESSAYATAAQGGKADTAIQSVTSVAGNGIKATATGTSVSLDWDSEVVFVFDCGDSTEG